MAQGKFKQKAKLPDSIKRKQKATKQAFTRRSNAPMKPKKNKLAEQQKIKQAISKMVNKSAEDELRGVAESNIKMSKAQEAVAKHHQTSTTSDAASNV